MNISSKIEEKIAYEAMTGCWLWLGAKTRAGYGVLTLGIKQHYVHRLSYTEKKGPIPKGRIVCHRCDTPACINPDHLFAGSYSDNIKDAYSKGRKHGANKFKTHCKNGHEFSPENTYNHVGKRGPSRTCRRCKIEWKRQRKALK